MARILRPRAPEVETADAGLTAGPHRAEGTDREPGAVGSSAGGLSWDSDHSGSLVLGWLVIIGAAATVYVATNIDNFLVLLAFFAHDGYTDAETVLGHFVGIGLLVAASLLGARAALLLPTPVVGLLGLVPLGLGIRRLLAGVQNDPAMTLADRPPRLARTLAVAGAAIGNGGDNVATYVPFFALLTSVELAGSLAVFAILTGLWCLVARAAVARTAGGRIAGLRGTRLVGVVMIGLGVAILVRSGTPGLLLGR